MFVFEPFSMVFTMAPLWQKSIRALFWAGEHVAPSLAGRVAFELFARTPDARRPSERERRALERAAGLLVEARRHCLTSRFGRITAFEFRPAECRAWRGTVLVLHGWASRTEHMKALIEGLLAAGHRVISLDLPGHGHSAGRRLTMVSAVDAVHHAGQWFGPFAAVVGHSFGGAVAVNAAAASVKGIPPLAVDRLVLIAAPSSMPTLFRHFGRALNLGERTYRSFVDRVEAIAGNPLHHYVGSLQLGRIALPTLVLHSRDDREVAAWHAEDHARAGGHVRLEWLNGLGHRRILADPNVVARSVAFVSESDQVALAG
jgi:pimeloyl-ACP methyl ester carboxylesterase